MTSSQESNQQYWYNVKYQSKILAMVSSNWSGGEEGGEGTIAPLALCKLVKKRWPMHGSQVSQVMCPHHWQISRSVTGQLHSKALLLVSFLMISNRYEGLHENTDLQGSKAGMDIWMFEYLPGLS